MIDLDLVNFENARYERKFVISDLKLQEIEHIIKFHPAMFSEIFYKRRVNNLYLDSIDRQNYRDNMEGGPKRLKVRIRWYGNLFGFIEKPVLELKMKYNEVGVKKSFLLIPFKLDKNFSKKILQEVFKKSNIPKQVLEILQSLNFSLLNSYKRRYFASMDKKNRITLDNDLVFFEIKDKMNLFKYKIENKKDIILELKYDKKNDDEISKITQYFPFRLTKSSKYVSGIDLLSM